jgi:hypothetical protein
MIRFPALRCSVAAAGREVAEVEVALAAYLESGCRKERRDDHDAAEHCGSFQHPAGQIFEKESIPDISTSRGGREMSGNKTVESVGRGKIEVIDTHYATLELEDGPRASLTPTLGCPATLPRCRTRSVLQRLRDVRHRRASYGVRESPTSAPCHTFPPRLPRRQQVPPDVRTRLGTADSEDRVDLRVPVVIDPPSSFVETQTRANDRAVGAGS